MNLVNLGDRAIRERKENRERPEKWELKDYQAQVDLEVIPESWALKEIGGRGVNQEVWALEERPELLETPGREEPSGKAAILDSGVTSAQWGSEDPQDPKERPVWLVLMGGRGFLDFLDPRASQGKTELLETLDRRDFLVCRECSG